MDNLVKLFKYINKSTFSEDEKKRLFLTFLLMNEDEILVIVRAIDNDAIVLKKFNDVLKCNNDLDNVVSKKEQDVLIQSMIKN